MSEWEEKLNTLLSDPDAMAQVMNMAQNLSQQMGQSGGSAPPPPPAARAVPRARPCPAAPASKMGAAHAKMRRSRRSRAD